MNKLSQRGRWVADQTIRSVHTLISKCACERVKYSPGLNNYQYNVLGGQNHASYLYAYSAAFCFTYNGNVNVRDSLFKHMFLCEKG